MVLPLTWSIKLEYCKTQLRLWCHQKATQLLHLVYVRDLKCLTWNCLSNASQHKRVTELVNSFSYSISISYGLDRHAVLHVQLGSVVRHLKLVDEDIHQGSGHEAGIQISEAEFTSIDETLEEWKPRGSSRGFNAPGGLSYISNTKLAIHSWVIFTYFKTSLEALDRKMRMSFTKYFVKDVF